MDKKLAQILEMLGVNHEVLNSPNVQDRKKARGILARTYPTVRVVLENVRGALVSKPRIVDGIKTERAVHSGLTARGFSENAFGLNAWKFVSFHELEKVIIVKQAGFLDFAAIPTIEVPLPTVTVREIEAEKELRDISEIPNIVDTPTIEVPLPTVTEGEIEKEDEVNVFEKAAKSRTKSV